MDWSSAFALSAAISGFPAATTSTYPDEIRSHKAMGATARNRSWEYGFFEGHIAQFWRYLHGMVFCILIYNIDKLVRVPCRVSSALVVAGSQI